MERVDLTVVERILETHRDARGTLIAILTDIQRECSYLPKEALEMVADRLRVPLSSVYGVSTFYKAFSLRPRGKHICQVCLGTACHVRGAPLILESFQRTLGVRPGQTTEDGQFTLETVNCVGACALAPVVVIDGRSHGGLTIAKVPRLVDAALKGAAE